MISRIKEELIQAQAVLDRWAEGQAVSDIERELVLAGLRDLYGQVLILGRNATAPQANAEPAAKSEETLAPQCEPHIEAIPFDMTAKETSPQQHEDSPQHGQENAPKSGIQIPEPAQMENPAEGTLFDSEPVKTVSRSPLDRRVILSLYGDELPRCSEAAEASQDTMLAGEEAAMTAACEQKGADTSTARTTPTQTTIGEANTVLGEVMNPAGERLSDALSKHAPMTDVASIVAAQTTVGLRSSIGVNDRFLIINDAFGNDEAAYEKALDELDSFTDPDEAMIYIHDSFSWNPNAAGVKLLVEILTRKLS